MYVHYERFTQFETAFTTKNLKCAPIHIREMKWTKNKKINAIFKSNLSIKRQLRYRNFWFSIKIYLIRTKYTKKLCFALHVHTFRESVFLGWWDFILPLNALHSLFYVSLIWCDIVWTHSRSNSFQCSGNYANLLTFIAWCNRIYNWQQFSWGNHEAGSECDSTWIHGQVQCSAFV